MEDGVMEDGEEKLLGGYNWKENTTRTKGLFCHLSFIVQSSQIL
jgi:hypothetical protein